MCSNGNEKYWEMIKNFESHQHKMLKKKSVHMKEKEKIMEIEKGRVVGRMIGRKDNKDKIWTVSQKHLQSTRKVR